MTGILMSATLKANGNDKLKAAQALGLSERTLYRRLKKLGL
jgi:transcriptional regulator with PAS, ATPase and Fis domain